jgi:hypothetical protein
MRYLAVYQLVPVCVPGVADVKKIRGYVQSIPSRLVLL